MGGGVCASICGDHSASAAKRGPKGSLTVRVIQAEKLKNVDGIMQGWRSDPSALVKVNGVERETSVVWNNLNPKWTSNNEFSFAGIPQAQSTQLDIELFDNEDVKGTTVRGKSIGSYSLDISPSLKMNGTS